MAQRDYVKKKTKTKKSSSRIIPNLMMGIAIILVIMFVAILYIVSTNKSNKPAVQPQVQTQKPETTLPEKPQERWTYLKELENPDSVDGGAPSNNTPSTPSTTVHQERQQILDHFMNDSASSATSTTQTTAPVAQNNTPAVQQQTPLPATSTASQDKWYLQCGAFKDLVNAQGLRAKIAMSGVTSEIKSATYHRVMAGPFASKSKAESTLATLKNNDITSCIISSK